MSGRHRRWRVALLACAGLALLAGCVPGPPELAAFTDPAASPEVAARASVVRIRNGSSCSVSIGSGFVIDGDRIVTNRHVVEGARELQVETWDGRPIAVGAARQARDTDLGVIELTARSARRLQPLPLAGDGAEPGDQLTAIGFPDAGPALITRGQLQDRPRHKVGERGEVLRMSTSLRHGNSGGPVLNADHEVVGVAFALDFQTNLTLAIPMERLRRLLDDPRGWQPVEPAAC